MNILLLGARGTPEEGGGYTLTNDIFDALLKNCGNSQHQFFLLEYSTTASNSNLPKNVTVIRVPRRNIIHRIVRRLAFEAGVQVWRSELRRRQKAARRVMKTYQLDCALALSPWDGIPSLPTIVVVWDLEHRRKPYFPELGSSREWESREDIYQSILPQAIAIITGTRAGKGHVQRFFNVDPEIIRVIPFPTPSFAMARAGQASHSATQLPDEVSGEYLFYPAQYWPHKNHIRLLEALQLLRRDHDWRGTIVFCGADKGNLEFLKRRARDLKVEEQVRFLGFVTENELVRLYQRAFALTFVSYLGPDNLPPLEAYALGCPVIASEVEGVEEVLGNAALFVNPNSAEEIVTAVMRLKRAPDLRRNLIEKGKERAAQHSSPEYVAALFEVFDALETRFRCFRCAM
jgi:glycosyltransferase involved in cell wall biosynthesis